MVVGGGGAGGGGGGGGGGDGPGGGGARAGACCADLMQGRARPKAPGTPRFHTEIRRLIDFLNGANLNSALKLQGPKAPVGPEGAFVPSSCSTA